MAVGGFQELRTRDQVLKQRYSHCSFVPGHSKGFAMWDGNWQLKYIFIVNHNITFYSVQWVGFINP